MNIGDKIRTSDLVATVQKSKGIDNELKLILCLLMNRIDSLTQYLTSQLRKGPTIFTVDPSTHPTEVEGAKEGDVAIFKNADGVIDIQRFD